MDTLHKGDNDDDNNNNNKALFYITAAFSHIYHQFPNVHSLMFLAHSDMHNTTQHQTNAMMVCKYHSQPLIVLYNTTNSST
jgi:hypothetical protein